MAPMIQPLRSFPVLLVVPMIFALAACARAPEASPAAGEAPIGSASVTTDVVYGHNDGLALTFDVYRPANANGAAVISVVSAGWRSSWETMQQFVPTGDGLRPMTMDEIREVGGYLPAHNYLGLLEAGFTVFSVRHGTSPRYDMASIVSDMRRAVRYIRFHAPEWAVDPDRLGIWGGSAGGHLGLLLLANAEPGLDDPAEDFEVESTRLAAAVAYFPPTDLERWATPEIRGQFPAVDLDPEQARRYSPIRFASADDGPSLILHGDADALVPIVEGESMSAALRAAGATAEFVAIEGSGHGFNGDDAARANALMVDWFARYLN
jgi:dienelactone hydrolase